MWYSLIRRFLGTVYIYHTLLYIYILVNEVDVNFLISKKCYGSPSCLPVSLYLLGTLLLEYKKKKKTN